MKRILLMAFVLISFNASYAQYRWMKIDKSSDSRLKIVQIDFYQNATIIHFQYLDPGSTGSLCISDKMYLKDNITSSRYRLLHSYNLPICDKKHLLDGVHNFSLEFEKTPSVLEDFDIVDNSEPGFSFYGVKIDTSISASDYLNVDSHIAYTPSKEYGYFYKDNNKVLYYKHKGLMIAVLLSKDYTYGSYYQAYILLQNFTGKDLVIDPSKVYFQVLKKGEYIYDHILTYDEYMKKVKNRQSWQTFAVAYSESISASRAGYSTYSSNSTTNFQSSSSGSTSGYYGNSTGSVSSNSNTYGTINTTTVGKANNNADRYAAQQNANRNIANYSEQQYNIRRRISEGYLKLNTIMNETEYIGYCNIPYVYSDSIILTVNINNTIYKFSW